MREERGAGAPFIAAIAAAGTDPFAPRAAPDSAPSRPARWPRYAAAAATLAMLSLLMPATRERLAHVWPASAKVFAAIGLRPAADPLAFADVVSRVSEENGARVLQIEGRVVNAAAAQKRLPAIRVTLRDSGGRDVYAWTAAPVAPTLAAGGSMPFRTRLAAPPEAVSQVLLRFAPREATPAAGGRS